MNRKVEQLRQKIDRRVSTAECSEALALLYVEQQISFELAALPDYIKDWTDRNIDAAELYIQRIITEDHSESAVLGLIQDQEKQIKVAQWFNKARSDRQALQQSVSSEDRALHYLNLDDDPLGIPYCKQDTLQYLKDWLAGIETAEGYILRTSSEDIRYMITVLDQIVDIRDIEKIIDLILKHQSDVNLVALFQFKKAFAGAQNAEEIATVLQDAFNFNLIGDVLGQPSFSNAFSTKLWRSVAILKLKDKGAVVEVRKHYPDQFHKKIAELLYMSALDFSNSSEEVLDLLRIIKNQFNVPVAVTDVRATTSVASGEGPKVFALDADITLAYYVASLSLDIEQLLDLAFHGNPKMFARLLLSEIDVLRDARKKNTIPGLNLITPRETFYRNLMLHADMRAFHAHADCLNAVNHLFSIDNRRPIEIPGSTSVVATRANLKFQQDLESPVVFKADSIPTGTTERGVDPVSSSSSSSSSCSSSSSSSTSAQSSGFLSFMPNFSAVFSGSSSKKEVNGITEKKVEDDAQSFFEI